MLVKIDCFYSEKGLNHLRRLINDVIAYKIAKTYEKTTTPIIFYAPVNPKTGVGWRTKFPIPTAL